MRNARVEILFTLNDIQNKKIYICLPSRKICFVLSREENLRISARLTYILKIKEKLNKWNSLPASNE